MYQLPIIVLSLFVSVIQFANAQTVLPELAEALDTNQVEFTVDNIGPFFSAFDSDAFDKDAARSEITPDNNFSLMETSIKGPAKVTFDWKVSSEPRFDFLLLIVTEIESNEVVDRDGISGNVPWTTKEVLIPEGEHSIVWAYVKDASLSAGQDAGWVDYFRITYPYAYLPAVQSLLLEDAEALPDVSDLSPPIEELTDRGPVVKLQANEIGLLPTSLTMVYNPQNARIDVSSNPDDALVISIFGDNESMNPGAENWFWVMKAKDGKLTPGFYESSQRYPYSTNAKAFEFSGLGRGCNIIDSRFTVYEIEYDEDNEPVKLIADFELTCEDIVDVVRGSIRFDQSKDAPQGPSALVPDFGQLTPYLPPLVGRGSLVSIESKLFSTVAPTVQGGRFLDYSPANANVRIRELENDRIQISITGETLAATGLSASITVLMRLSSGALEPGSYTAISRNPQFNQNSFSISGYPTLSGNCGGNLVNFTIYEIARNLEGEIVKLTFDFERPCEFPGASGHPLRGSVRFDSSLPQDFFPPLQTVQTELNPDLPDLVNPGSLFRIVADPNQPNGVPIDYSTNNLVSLFNYQLTDNQRDLRINIGPPPGVSGIRSVLHISKGTLLGNPDLDTPLAPGIYRSAINDFGNDVAPLLHSEGPNRFCTPAWGFFNIYEISFTEDDELNSITLDFTQYCEGNDHVAKGSLRFER